MHIPRFMIAAVKSGSGKTVLTMAMLEALRQRGVSLRCCKCGPDYIDPMFHREILGLSSRNLDTFFTSPQLTREIFLSGRQDGDLVVMEGVMGLYDGLGGTRPEGSSYDLAKITGTPVILVLNARGMSRSALAVLRGFVDYDSDHLIRGFILNEITRTSYDRLKPLIEEELNIPVLGYMPHREELAMGRRHLGLLRPSEIRDLKENAALAAQSLESSVDVDRILKIAESAPPFEESPSVLFPAGLPRPDKAVFGSGPAADEPVIAVARDPAFCFYYEENLMLLRYYGARIVEFSPLYDKKLPDNISGLILGGGYPELSSFQLNANESMRSAVREAVLGSMPTLAECGGFLYLQESIDGKQMTSVLPGQSRGTGRLVRSVM